jgi:hypothetical protein
MAEEATNPSKPLVQRTDSSDSPDWVSNASGPSEKNRSAACIRQSPNHAANSPLIGSPSAIR